MFHKWVVLDYSQVLKHRATCQSLMMNTEWGLKADTSLAIAGCIYAIIQSHWNLPVLWPKQRRWYWIHVILPLHGLTLKWLPSQGMSPVWRSYRGLYNYCQGSTQSGEKCWNTSCSWLHLLGVRAGTVSKAGVLTKRTCAVDVVLKSVDWNGTAHARGGCNTRTVCAVCSLESYHYNTPVFNYFEIFKI